MRSDQDLKLCRRCAPGKHERVAESKVTKGVEEREEVCDENPSEADHPREYPPKLIALHKCEKPVEHGTHRAQRIAGNAVHDPEVRHVRCVPFE